MVSSPDTQPGLANRRANVKLEAMKKYLLIVFGVIILAVAGYIAFRVLNSRQLSPSQTVTYQYQGLDVKVVYCRPSKRGRLIFGEAKDSALLPYGKYWRLGANEATEITFSKDVSFGGKSVQAGSYRLYAIPNAASWQVSLNSELGKWGYDEPNHTMDIITLEIPVETEGSPTELFTISFSESSSGMNMDMKWDTTHVSVPITTQ